MKTLSLTQPWAQLVVIGAKKFETRSWTTTYRGPLLIHAAKGFPASAKFFARTEFTLGRLPARIARGAIIGRVVLKNIYRTEEIASTLTPLERLYGDYTPGRWAWELADTQMFETPIPYKGSLGLFEVTLPMVDDGSVLITPRRRVGE